MNRRMKKTLLMILIVATLTMSLAATSSAQSMLWENEPTAGHMAGDFIFVRPFAIAGLALGAVVYGLSWPFSYWGNNEEQARQKLVIDPFEFAFKRPLGDASSTEW